MSKAPKDGGPAFPVSAPPHTATPGVWQESYAWTGMSLRDYFAAQAMQGMLIGRAILIADPDGPTPEQLTIPDEAKDAYRYADAMLAERSNTKEDSARSP